MSLRQTSLTHVIALALLAAASACESTTESSPPAAFRATLDGAVKASVSGSATAGDSYDRQISVAFPGEAGAAFTVIGLSANNGEHVVSLTVPGAQPVPGSYAVAALNKPAPGAPKVVAHGGYVRTFADGRLQFFRASAGTVVIDSVAGNRVHGRFSLHADAYEILPALRTLTNNAPTMPLEQGTAALDVSGSFSAASRRR